MDIRRERSPDPPLASGRPQVSVVRFLISIFVIVSQSFPLILSRISSGFDPSMQWCGLIWRRVVGGPSKKAEESCHFRQFVHAPWSTGIRLANVVSSSHLADCRGSSSIIGGTQGVLEEDLFDCGVAKTFGWCHGEFLVVFDRFSI